MGGRSREGFWFEDRALGLGGGGGGGGSYKSWVKSVNRPLIYMYTDLLSQMALHLH